MADIDFDRASVLMDVIHKIATISPKNTNLLGMAQAELQEIEDAAREERNPPVEEAPVAEPKRVPVFPKDAVDQTDTRRV